MEIRSSNRRGLWVVLLAALTLTGCALFETPEGRKRLAGAGEEIGRGLGAAADQLINGSLLGAAAAALGGTLAAAGRIWGVKSERKRQAEIAGVTTRKTKH